jgi:hypothetical protein
MNPERVAEYLAAAVEATHQSSWNKGLLAGLAIAVTTAVAVDVYQRYARPAQGNFEPSTVPSATGNDLVFASNTGTFGRSIL